MAILNMMGNLPSKLFNKEVDYEADTIKLMLLTSSATPNVDVHVYIEDLEGNEVGGTGYTAGGSTLTGKTVSYSESTDTTTFDADDVVWSSSTITARYCVLYDSDSSVILGYADFGVDKSTLGDDFTVTFSSSGIFTSVV